MYLNHILTPCKPLAYSNTTYHYKSNFLHHKCRILQVFKSKKILFFTSNQQYSFTFAINVKHSQMYLNHLITSCKPHVCSNTTTHHKTNFQHHKYRILQVLKSNKILFITSNQQYSFTFARNEKRFQYVLKPPFNTMKATHLLQHNIPLQIQFPTSEV